jgi:hypothetical protein
MNECRRGECDHDNSSFKTMMPMIMIDLISIISHNKRPTRLLSLAAGPSFEYEKAEFLAILLMGSKACCSDVMRTRTQELFICWTGGDQHVTYKKTISSFRTRNNIQFMKIHSISFNHGRNNNHNINGE